MQTFKVVGLPGMSGKIEASRIKTLAKLFNSPKRLVLSFSDGSFAAIHYLANGSKGFPKERVEVFVAGKILQLNNFRSMKGWGWSNFSSMKLWRQDKGQLCCTSAFINSLQVDREPLIPKDEILEVARVSIEIAEAARKQ